MLHRIGRLACVVIVCSALALLAGSHAALASDQVVTDCGDSGGPNQLRAKLAAAQSSGGGTITFTCGPATIVLTGGVLPTITSNVTINGEGKITLSGNNASRLFFVDTGGGLALDGLALTKGYDVGSGGALYMYNSTLDANNVTFKDNRADIDGGALYAYSAVVNLTNVTFDHNQATDDGGRYSAASIFVHQCDFHQQYRR
jgi:hypothetical protein